MKMKLISIYALIFVMSLSSFTYAQEAGKFSGYMFGDAYYVAKNHDKSIENLSGFQFRRIYLGYDRALDSNYSVRLRLEMSNKGNFTTKAKMEPVVKDAYLRYKKGNRSLYLGLSGTPTWGLTESVWGYRAVEKTVMDLQKFGSSRDMGFALKGKSGKVNYHFMIGNGNSNSSEVGKGKKVMGSLAFDLGNGVVFEAYGDAEDKAAKSSRTVQGFLAVKKDDFRLGLQLVRKWKKHHDDPYDLLSVWGASKFSDKAWGFARFDKTMQANSSGGGISYLPFDPSAKSNLVIFGIDISPVKDVHFMPNIEYIFYSETNGSSPDADIIPRFTFYYKF